MFSSYRLAELLLIFSFLLPNAVADGSNNFLNMVGPGDLNDMTNNPNFTTGQTLDLQWATTYAMTDLRLWQPAVYGSYIYLFQNYKKNSFNWTIDFDNSGINLDGYNQTSDIAYNTFYLFMYETGTSNGFTCHYFNISKAAAVPSTSTSPGSTATPSSTNAGSGDLAAANATPTSSASSAPAVSSSTSNSSAVGIGVGVTLGVLALAGALGLGFWLARRRANRAAVPDVGSMPPPAYPDPSKQPPVPGFGEQYAPKQPVMAQASPMQPPYQQHASPVVHEIGDSRPVHYSELQG